MTGSNSKAELPKALYCKNQKSKNPKMQKSNICNFADYNTWRSCSQGLHTVIENLIYDVKSFNLVQN